MFTLAVDGPGNVYVAGAAAPSQNVFKITPGGVIIKILDATGDGSGNAFGAGHAIDVDGAGNVYIPGFFTNNAFKIAPNGTVTEIIDATGSGVAALDRPMGIVAAPAGKVYVSGEVSDNVFEIALCGDGVQDADEECDDGNLDPSDGCTEACTICGNGGITAPEECDDGGMAANDGCNPACRLEACFTCGAAPSVCAVLEDCIKCQRTIAKEAQKFLAKKSKELQKCWDKRLKGDHADTCPDAAAPLGTPARTAADKIARVEAKMQAKLCNACGGADKLCDGVDDFLPGTIGFPTTCDVVMIPGGASCAGAVNTLQDLVGCVACVTEFKVDCMDAAQVPEFVPYPPECNP